MWSGTDPLGCTTRSRLAESHRRDEYQTTNTPGTRPRLGYRRRVPLGVQNLSAQSLRAPKRSLGPTASDPRDRRRPGADCPSQAD